MDNSFHSPILKLAQTPPAKIGLYANNLSEDAEGLDHIYVTGRDPNSSDMKELHRSMIVTIEKTPENYICIHNVLQLMNRHSDIKLSGLKWKPYNDQKFLITLENNEVRDKFLVNNSVLYFGETCVRFKAFEVNEDSKKTPMTFKVWVVIKGLPAQHLCYKTAELVACRFGRLYACDLLKKESFVGAFRIMVDCNDIRDIPPGLVLHFEEDGERIIEIQKEYLCSIESYKSMNFDEDEMNFEEVMYALLEANKLTPLK